MKRIITMAVLLILPASVYAQGAIKCEADETKEVTLCKSKSIALSVSDSDASRATLHLVYILEIESYLLVPSFTSTEWQYQNTERVDFLLDGERENYKLQPVDSNEMDSNVIEQYYIQLDAAAVERFISAEEISFEIDNDRYELPDEALNNLRALSQRIAEL